MSFTERLEFLMRRNGISNKSELARMSGIPYTTIDGFYKKGTDNIKLSTLRKLQFDQPHPGVELYSYQIKLTIRFLSEIGELTDEGDQL